MQRLFHLTHAVGLGFLNLTQSHVVNQRIAYVLEPFSTKVDPSC